MKRASVIGHAAALAMASALALTLGWLYLPLAVSAIPALWVAAGAALAGVAVLRLSRRPRADAGFDAHACGSCGRSYPSRRELREHREAVHARGLRSHAA